MSKSLNAKIAERTRQIQRERLNKKTAKFIQEEERENGFNDELRETEPVGRNNDDL